MKILVTGADGMLGSCLMRRLSGHRLTPLYERECDITDVAAVERLVHRVDPEAVIHTAALTDVEACESAPERTFAVNTGGTENLVHAAGPDTLFVYISSTGIYGGHKGGPYTEEDEVRPPTVHHRSKREAERIVAAAAPRHIILRIGWLFGAGLAHPRNFVVQRYKEAQGREVILSDETQTGNPTYAENVATQMEDLLNRQSCGVFNCVDHNPATRLEYVKEIIKLAGLPCRVEPAPPGHFKRVAPVSPNESAVNERLAALGIDRMEDWRTSLARYIRILGLR